MPTCQRRVNFSNWRPNFSTIFQKNVSIFEFFNYARHFQISRIFEQSCETKNLTFDIRKISFKKNLVNLKPLTSFSKEHVGLPNNYSSSVKWSSIYFFIYLNLYTVCKKTYLEKHTSCTPYKSCWKSMHYVNWLRNYCTVGTTVLENIFVRNRKKHSYNKVSYNCFGSPAQADHKSRRS